MSKATLAGAIAILMWSSLALLTVATVPVPPFLLAALTFGIAAIASLILIVASGRLGELRRASPGQILFGTAGLFLYHALYFQALRLAPAAEAGLVAYLWPLLIVVFATLIGGQRLKAGHLIGGLLGLAGTTVLLGARRADVWPETAALGLALAFGCALIWSLYSVLLGRMAKAPTEAVAMSCALTAALALIVHLLIEPTIWPIGPTGWVSVLALGLGPVGLAFFAWDHAMKRGDARLLGVLSYAAPVLSTLLLVAFGQAQAGWPLLIATVLVSLGAVVASR